MGKRFLGVKNCADLKSEKWEKSTERDIVELEIKQYLTSEVAS